MHILRDKAIDYLTRLRTAQASLSELFTQLDSANSTITSGKSWANSITAYATLAKECAGNAFHPALRQGLSDIEAVCVQPMLSEPSLEGFLDTAA